MFDKSKYDSEFAKNNYDRVIFTIPKGCKEELKQVAIDNGLSVNQLIIQTLEDTYFVDLHTKRKQKDK